MNSNLAEKMQKAELFVGKKHIITIYGLSSEKTSLQEK